ncbi:MAG: hypothetical protein SFW08_13910 [Gemmatimonadaceae bacterium]|nr:hypothetical protein [Gemmatimonadaceae bacterium]
MAISPLTPNPTLPLRTPSNVTSPTVDRGADVRTPAATPSRIDRAPTMRPAAPPAPASSRALGAEPPAGVDPQLWSVLTTDERAHFAKLAQMGPLTYGRNVSAFSASTPTPPAARGARLDVRI